jgi:Ca2+-transporting ATPase
MDEPPADSRAPWHVLELDAVLRRVASSRDGLATAEAERRRALQGSNELKQDEAVAPFVLLLRQFQGLIVMVLLASVVVSGLLGEWVDAIAIFAIVVLNGLIGFYQEWSAEKSIAALRKLTAPQCRVRRDGRLVQRPAADLVPGDIVALEAGDLVPADSRLIEAAALRCVESALTGESEAVDKVAATLRQAELPLGDRTNLVFTGTTVAAGCATAVVFAHGMSTEIGRIAGLLHEAASEEGTPLQRRLQAFGRVLVWASLGIVVVLFGLGLLRGEKLLGMFMTSVSLAVAAVPEGLPAIVTVALALGVTRMARRRALVRKLPAVETLGSTSVICTDKTGTLTVGQMTVRALDAGGRVFSVSGEGYGPDGVVTREGGALDAVDRALVEPLATTFAACCSARIASETSDAEPTWTVVGDPTEGALLAAASKAGIEIDALERAHPKLAELPFDAARKLMTIVRARSGGRRAFVKGAPDVLLARCDRELTAEGERPLDEPRRRALLARAAAMGGRALRVLAAGFRDLAPEESVAADPDRVERGLVFVGLAGMYDPPRPEVKDAVRRCREAGIRVVMITGDHPQTALAVARELGIADASEGSMSGVELDRASDAELAARLPSTAVFARVAPEHKLRIVRAWRKRGAVVAMTGDGVNDAPALRAADVGVAMGGSGTEVTKQAAQIVVADDNFASIVAAVEEGRGIYDNIRKTLQYLLAGNTGELLLVAGCVIGGLSLPLLPIHLLWINLVTDGLPALCLATDPIDRDVMRRPPRPAAERIIDGGFLPQLLLTGVLTAGVAFAVFRWSLGHESLAMARTHAFALLVFAELLRSFGARSERRFAWETGFASNLSLLLVVSISFGLQVASHHVDWMAAFLKTAEMSWAECTGLMALGAIPFAVLEVLKALRRWRNQRRAAAMHLERGPTGLRRAQ